MDRDKINLDLVNKNVSPSLDVVSNFFELNKSNNFRYFDKRKFDVVKNHKYTCIYSFNNINFGYGHIDQDGDKNWLGIFISEKYRGLGIGKFIMNDLILKTNEDIYLTVDIDNYVAIKLYEKIGFKYCENKNNHHLMIYKK